MSEYIMFARQLANGLQCVCSPSPKNPMIPWLGVTLKQVIISAFSHFHVFYFYYIIAIGEKPCISHFSYLAE